MTEAYVRSVPPWALAVAGFLLVAAAITLAVTLRRGQRGAAGWTVFSVVLLGILLITLTPSGDSGGSRWCGLDSWRLVRPSQVLSLGHDALNVWVFVLWGVSVVLLPRSQAVIGAVVILLLPPIIELIQYALPALGRSCQSDDLVHNWTGALVGLLVAATARGLAKARPGR